MHCWRRAPLSVALPSSSSGRRGISSTACAGTGPEQPEPSPQHHSSTRIAGRLKSLYYAPRAIFCCITSGERAACAERMHSARQLLDLGPPPDTEHATRGASVNTRNIAVCRLLTLGIDTLYRVARLPQRERLVRRLRGVRRSINYLTRSSSIVSLAWNQLKCRLCCPLPLRLQVTKIDQ